MENNAINTDIAIIGAGPVGMFAVFQAGMLGLSTVLIDSLEVLGGQCAALYPEKPIYDIPAYPKILASDLIDNLYEQAKPFKPDLILGSTVTLLNKKSDLWELITSKNQVINAKAIIIAAGGGAFGPNRPPINNIMAYEGKSVFYMVSQKDYFADKTVVIAGGGDSAVDWAVVLADVARKVYVVHRRDKFRAMPESLRKMHELVDKGKIELVIPFQLNGLNGENGCLNSVEVIDLEGNTKLIEADCLLPFFGLSMELGPIHDWGLNLDKKHIAVDPSNMQTSEQGIYAVGDIATYKGKLKLILCGFSEAAMACQSIYSMLYPNKPLHFEYSTTKGVPQV